MLLCSDCLDPASSVALTYYSVCVSTFKPTSAYAWTLIPLCICVCVCVYVCLYIAVDLGYTSVDRMYIFKYVCVCVCVCVCMCVYEFSHTYACISMDSDAHAHTQRSVWATAA